MGNIHALAALGTRIPILYSTGDTTDRTNEIQAMLNRYNAVFLGVGTFYCTNITLTANQSIIGSGDGTILYQSSASGYLITCSGGNVISDLTLKSSGTDAKPAAYDGTKHGISIQSNTKSNKISNCNITNFSGNGVYVADTGYSILESVRVVNCAFRYNGIGIQLDTYGEYASISNCTFRSNYVGAYNNGGNNQFASSHFVANTYGFWMVAAGHANHGHGSVVGCSFNHNTDTGIRLQGDDNGFVFIGCQIFANTTYDVLLTYTIGILIANSQFGSSAKIIIKESGSYVVRFSDNIFVNAPTFTVTNSTNIIINGCYQQNGAEIKIGPSLVPDTTGNTVGNAVDITFVDNATWRGAVTGVTVDGADASGHYTFSEGNLNIDATMFATAKTYSVVITATGYSVNTASQVMAAA